MNTSSTESDVLSNAQMYNETSFVHDFDGDVEYCQILTVNVTAVSALGSSLPGSAAMGFPIGKLILKGYVFMEIVVVHVSDKKSDNHYYYYSLC